MAAPRPVAVDAVAIYRIHEMGCRCGSRPGCSAIVDSSYSGRGRRAWFGPVAVAEAAWRQRPERPRKRPVAPCFIPPFTPEAFAGDTLFADRLLTLGVTFFDAAMIHLLWRRGPQSLGLAAEGSSPNRNLLAPPFTS